MATIYDATGTEAAALEDCAPFLRGRVLEVGCGNGRVTWRYAAAAAEVQGVDTDDMSLAVARASLPSGWGARVRFLRARAEEMELPPARWDAIIFSWSL